MTSSSRSAFASLLGLVAIAAIPCGALVAQRSQSVSLLDALYVSVPIAIVLGLLAVLVARGARLQVARSVFGGGKGFARFAQVVAWAGLWVGITGGVALAVYGALRWAS